MLMHRLRPQLRLGNPRVLYLFLVQRAAVAAAVKQVNYRFLRVAATQPQLVLVKAAVAVVLVVIDLRCHLVGCKTSGNFRKYCKCSSGLPSKLAAALHATDPWGRGSNPAATHKPFYLFFKFPTPLIHGAGDRIPLTPTNVFIFFFKFCTPLIHGA